MNRTMLKLLLTLTMALVAAVAIAGPASAGTVQVGVKDGNHTYVRWNLDGGDTPFSASTRVSTVEIATTPASGSDGFYSENTVVWDLIDSGARQGEWVSSYPLDPGTYYLHLQYERSTDYHTWYGSTHSFTVPRPVLTGPPAWSSCATAKNLWLSDGGLHWQGRKATCVRSGDYTFRLEIRYRVFGDVPNPKRTRYVGLELTSQYDYIVLSSRTLKGWH